MQNDGRTPAALKQMQALPLEAKIQTTKQRISQWISEYGMDGVYVSFSGGKDSTVLLDIVRKMEAETSKMFEGIGFNPVDPIPAVFVNTGLEYPEIQKFAMSQPGVITVRPEMRFDEVVKKYGYPVVSKEVARRVQYARTAFEQGRAPNNGDWQRLNGLAIAPDGTKSRYNCEKWKFLLDAPFRCSSECCTVMKKKPVYIYGKQSGRMPIVATMASESRLRQSAWMKDGCNAFNTKHPQSRPMSFWTEQDVLEYLVKYSVPYCSVYGEIKQDETGKWNTTGTDRTGCIFCCFGCHLEKEPNRFQRLKETHPRQYNYCINGGEYVGGKWQPSKEGLGIGKVLDYIGVLYE